MEVTAPGRRLLSSGLPAMVLLAGIALLVIFSYVPQGPAPSRTNSVLAVIELTDDDGDAALFDTDGGAASGQDRRMRPGRTVQRCLAVTRSGPAASGTVYFRATGVSGDLAPHLQVKVEQGTGGAFGDCTGFAATHTVFEGTLAALDTADSADSRVGLASTGWAPAGGDKRTFRVSVAVQDRSSAQGKLAVGTFQWVLVPDPVVPPPPTTGPTADPPAPAVTGTPAATATSPVPATPSAPGTPPAPATPPAGGTPAAPSVTAPPVPPPTLNPPPAGTPTASTTPDGPPRAPSGDPAATGEPSARPLAPAATPTPPTPSDPPAAPATSLAAGATGLGARVAAIGKVLTEVAERAAELATRTAEHGALPAGALGVVLAFLALQNQIDRRDPKLRLAPVNAEHLEFDPPQPTPALTVRHYRPTASGGEAT